MNAATTLPTHPTALPMQYAHKVEYGHQVARVTPTNWRRAFLELVYDCDRDLRRKDAGAIAMGRELLKWEQDNAEAIQKEIELMERRDAKPVKPAPSPPIRRVRSPKEPRPDAPCAVCGAVFSPSNAVHIYCSRECRDKKNTYALRPPKKRTVGNGRKSRQKPKVCKECGVSIDRYRAVFCVPCAKSVKRARERARSNKAQQAVSSDGVQ